MPELKLETGCKYTYVGFSLRGMPFHLQFDLRKITIVANRYAGVNQQTHVLYCKPQGRQVRIIHLQANKQFIIWAGFVTPNTDITVATTIEDWDSGPVQKCYHWPEWNARYMHRALESVPKEPLIKHIAPMPVHPAKLVEYCTVIN